MTYSLITLCCDKLAVTGTCLPSLVRSLGASRPGSAPRLRGDWELVVVDNGSQDGTHAWLSGVLRPLVETAGGRLVLLRNAWNAGCSPARNQALAAASGEFIVFLDNDVMPGTPDWLPRLRAVLDAHPTAGMVGPKMIYPTPPHAIQCAGVGISRRGHVCFLGRGEPRDSAEFSRPREVQCLISACMMIRARLVRDHGGFDVRYHPVQFEDFDLCYRFRSHGWKALYEPSVEMMHLESVTTQGTPSVKNAAAVIRNGLLFQRLWHTLFEAEEGPPEEACRWRQLPATDLPSLFPVPVSRA
jgi:GT2 family glycosyltransferase